MLLTPGDTIEFDPGSTQDVAGLAQVYDRLDDDDYLLAWDSSRGDANAMGNPHDRLKQIRDFFEGRRYVGDLFEDEPCRIPVLMVTPAGGKVVAKYTEEATGQRGASLKIVGSGVGAGFTTALARGLEFEATDPGQRSSILISVLVTAHLFDHDGKPEIITDVRRAASA